MDVAHDLASRGAPAGTVVLADAQTEGRGRSGHSWVSAPLDGLWLTLVERPADVSGIDVLSLRLGVRLSQVLEPFADAPILVKWPNDLYLGARKLAGILVEVRWRAGSAEWCAVGVGVNMRAPAGVNAAALRDGVERAELFRAIVAAARESVAARGALTEAELQRFARRDAARGRRCTAPGVGIVAGISSTGALVIATDHGPEHFRSGSLAFAGESP